MRKTMAAGALTVCAVAVAAPVSGLAAQQKQRPATKAFTAKLTGAAERPGPGDPNGKGTAVIRFNERRGTVCFTVNVKGIAGAAAAHIHEAPRDKAGPIVVTLFSTQSAKRQRKGCVEVARTLAREIVANPRDFYVNVHNADFPAGAVRGQLRGKGKSR